MVNNNELLGLVAKQSLESAFIKEYQVLDEQHLDDALGIALASYCDWGGERMHAIIFSMLEDANFHSLNLVIDKWFEKNMKPKR